MKKLIGTATIGLPALAGVLLGIRSFTEVTYYHWLLGDIALIAFGYSLLRVGIGLIPSSPAVGRWFVETWILSSIGVMALATFAILYIALEPLPSWLGVVVGDERTKAVTSAFAGAITAYITLVWTKDITEGKGYFWPSTQFKDGLASAWEKKAPSPGRGTAARAAMFDDYIENVGKIGWDFSDRGKRNEIIQSFIDTNRNTA